MALTALYERSAVQRPKGIGALVGEVAAVLAVVGEAAVVGEGVVLALVVLAFAVVACESAGRAC
jgi:hypothetical protein